MVKSVFSVKEQPLITNAMPMSREAAPEEIVNLVLWLSPDKASFVSGTHYTIDDALTAAYITN